MLVWILVVLNIPVYLFYGWLLYDKPDNFADSFFEITVAVLKAILIPRFIRVLMQDEDETGFSMVTMAMFLFACGITVYGEYWLIAKYFPTWAM
jgi:hypothetical protein